MDAKRGMWDDQRKGEKGRLSAELSQTALDFLQQAGIEVVKVEDKVL